MSNKFIEVRDLLVEAKEEEYPIKITVGYIEIEGYIQEIGKSHLIVKTQDLEFNVSY